MATSKKKTAKKATKKAAKKEPTLELPEGWVEYDGKAFSSARKVESYKRREAVKRGEA